MVFASWLEESWILDVANEYNGWILWKTTAWLIGFVKWNGCLKRIGRRMVRAKKQTEWETVDHCHARGGVGWSNGWLEKTKNAFVTKWDVCDTLVVSRPGTIVYKTILLKSSLAWIQNVLGSNAFLGKRFKLLKSSLPGTQNSLGSEVFLGKRFEQIE